MKTRFFTLTLLLLITCCLNNLALAQDALHIAQNGDIGIGNTQPYTKLDVTGNIYTTVHGSDNLHDASNRGIRRIGMQSGNSDDGFAGMELVTEPGTAGGNHGILLFKTWGYSVTVTREAMRIDDRNKVTIGSNGGGSLDVNGRIRDQTGYVMPVGSIIAYGGNNAPDGWLLCNGQPLNDAKYNDLRAVVGSNAPDLRSRFIVGAGQSSGLSGYSLGSTGGEEMHKLTVAEMPSHKHYGFGEAYGDWPLGTQGGANQRGSSGGVDNDNYLYGTTSAGGDQPHENRPPYFALTYIIKY